jgi:hypothetical protein
MGSPHAHSSVNRGTRPVAPCRAFWAISRTRIAMARRTAAPAIGRRAKPKSGCAHKGSRFSHLTGPRGAPSLGSQWRWKPPGGFAGPRFASSGRCRSAHRRCPPWHSAASRPSHLYSRKVNEIRFKNCRLDFMRNDTGDNGSRRLTFCMGGWPLCGYPFRAARWPRQRNAHRTGARCLSNTGPRIL